jgi:NADH:ubiquinone oxidoreductase subunit 6 (subunit J)
VGAVNVLIIFAIMLVNKKEVYDWMRPESNENKDKVSNPNN